MAPRSLRGAFLTLILILLGAAFPIPLPAHADAPGESPALRTHTIKFFLDPALATDIGFAKTVLPKYVSDMNLILAKNTIRRLTFDPNTGILLTKGKPHTDSARPPLPNEGFEIWVHAVRTTNIVSHGGYAGIDSSGAGVLAGLKWTRLYDPDDLSPNEVLDYTIQIDHMLHELTHVFGAGMGEYYNLDEINDSTGIEPLLNINLNDSDDPFWKDKLDFMTDPLLRFTQASSREEYLSKVRYSELTAAILNGDYRNGLPSFTQSTIRILDENNQPIPNANVKVWQVQGVPPYLSQLVLDGWTNEHGEVVISWGDPISSHNANNFLRLIKVYCEDAPSGIASYVSIFDVDIAKLVNHQETHIIRFTIPTTLETLNTEDFLIYLPLTAKNLP